jgi:hypothetical protein
MGICRYCEKKAGWFSDVHDDCVKKATTGIEKIRTCVAEAVIAGKRYSEVSATIIKLGAEAAIPQDQVNAAIKEGWDKGAEQKGKAQPISDEEFDGIERFFIDTGLKISVGQGTWAITFSNLIWEVLHEKIRPDPTIIPRQLPEGATGVLDASTFNLKTGEVPVWKTANVWLRQEVSTTSHFGGYSGASVRIANGLWYRFGEMRGHKEQTSSVRDVDAGGLLITTRGIYFSGNLRGMTFFAPYNQIIRFRPYLDAIGICRNGMKEQILAPQYMVWPNGVSAKDCGWFLFNILQGLAARDSAQRSGP